MITDRLAESFDIPGEQAMAGPQAIQIARTLTGVGEQAGQLIAVRKRVVGSTLAHSQKGIENAAQVVRFGRAVWIGG